MKKKGYTLIELLSAVVILAIISAIAIPRILDTIGASKLVAYDVAKKNILSSAKLKYLSDVNNSRITEYTVDDLVEAGYLKKGVKNPITNDDYKNTKVLITNEDGDVSYKYIEGNTLYDIISKLNDKDGIYKVEDNYIFKGVDSKNYISFSGDIYRILKIDSYRNIYLIKDENVLINKNSLDNYLTTYLNDNYLENIREKIISSDVLDYDDYNNSFLDNESYITNNNDIWVKVGNERRVLSYLNNKLINKDNANVKIVIKVKNNVVISSGDGSQLNPYIIEK